MQNLVISIFVVLHGLVHLFYFALSRGLVELPTPIVGWPERSWVFSNLVDASATRSLASVLYVVATIMFVLSGAGILIRANWWTPMLVGAAVFSSALTILFWDGKMQQMPEKGFVGLLINLVLLAGVYLLNRLSIAL
jgi:hypothetical protein